MGRVMINITYDTTEKQMKSEVTFSYVRASTRLELLRIIRSKCGSGAASKRFRYEGVFVAPKDAIFARNGEIRVNIARKLNPQFNPKDYVFIGDVAIC